jgi:hypothetical protein
MEEAYTFYVHLDYFTAIWYILLPFGIFHLVIWCIFPHFGMRYQEKSGNPAPSYTTNTQFQQIFAN